MEDRGEVYKGEVGNESTLQGSHSPTSPLSTTLLESLKTSRAVSSSSSSHSPSSVARLLTLS